MAGDGVFAAVLRLRVRRAAPVCGRHLHAAFLQGIAAVDPALATRLHAAHQPRPFTLALLPTPPGHPGELLARCTILDDAVVGAFQRAWEENEAPRVVRLGMAEYELNRLEGAPSVWTGQSTWRALQADASAAEELHIDFASPTCFSRGEEDGRVRHDLFPLPEWVWESWARKWSTWAPEALDSAETAQLAGRWLQVANYSLRTQTVDQGRYRQKGFLGLIRYEARPGAPAAALRRLSLLADFAFYAGTGYKTAQGLGLTRRCAR